jgi:hypothetical protein
LKYFGRQIVNVPWVTDYTQGCSTSIKSSTPPYSQKPANSAAAFEPICTAGRLPAFAAVPSCDDKCLSLGLHFFRPNAGVSVGKPTQINIGRMLEKDANAVKTLQHWETDAGNRDPQALAKIPEPEQEACRKLWADVANLLKKLDNK